MYILSLHQYAIYLLNVYHVFNRGFNKIYQINLYVFGNEMCAENVPLRVSERRE